MVVKTVVEAQIFWQSLRKAKVKGGKKKSKRFSFVQTNYTPYDGDEAS